MVAFAAPYLLDQNSQTVDDMSAPLQHRIVPRLSSLAAQLANARSYLPAIQKPLTATTTTRASHLSPSSAQYFSSSAKMTHDTMTFKDAVHNRRTIYQLTKKSTISDDKIKEIVTTAVKDVPSSFNSQSARLVVLLKEEHDKFWQIVEDVLRAHVPAEKWEHTGQRIAMFKGAYGTVRLALRNYSRCMKLISRATDPLLRRPRTHQSSPIQTANLCRQIPSVVGTHVGHAPIHALDSLGGGRNGMQSPALQSTSR